MSKIVDIMADTKIIEKFQLSRRYREEPNIWDDYSLLTNKYNPVSLGQGFPDFLVSSPVMSIFVDTILYGDISLHQYTRQCGHPRLIKALSKLYSPLMKRNIDPFNDIIICSGGCATLHSVIIGNVQKGDEVILIEPSFDAYKKIVHAAGGIVKQVPLRLRQSDKTITSADWILDSKELQNAFNESTKAIILNTPHNPFGKVFSIKELTEIADLCKKWNVLCISDEVYEWFVYEPSEHIQIASLPGMWERSITVGSAGKTFCVTGWKVAWSIGPAHLIKNLQIQLPFVSNTIQQEVVAIAFEKELLTLNNCNSYFAKFKKKLQTKRNYIVQVLKKVGMNPIVPEGGIFVVADWTPLENKVNLSSEDDVYKDFCFTKWFAKKVGVLGIPVSTFYSKENKGFGQNFVRFCFIKKDQNLQKAGIIMEKWINSVSIK